MKLIKPVLFVIVWVAVFTCMDSMLRIEAKSAYAFIGAILMGLYILVTGIGD